VHEVEAVTEPFEPARREVERLGVAVDADQARLRQRSRRASA